MHTAARLKVCGKLESELADHPDYSRRFLPEESSLDVTFLLVSNLLCTAAAAAENSTRP